MSDEKKDAPAAAETPKPFVFDEAKAKAHIKDVEDYLITFAGQKAHNPYMVINNTINPLKNQFCNGVRTEELFNKIMGLKKTPPEIPGLKENHEAEEVQMKARAVPVAAMPQPSAVQGSQLSQPK